MGSFIGYIMTDRTINDGVTSTSFIDNGDNLIVKKSQDISHLIEYNKSQYNQSDERQRWDGNNAYGNKVASIPLVVFNELDKLGITRGFSIIDHKRFKEFLNNPDNRVFRTRTGKI